MKNESKFKDLEIYNNSQKIILNSNKRQTIPISWLIEKRNPSLYFILNHKKQLLIKDINDKNNINKFIRFDNEQVIMIDIIKYKLNLDEYYLNKNISKQKEEIFLTDLIITSPIHIMNNTPYDFSINSIERPVISDISAIAYPLAFILRAFSTLASALPSAFPWANPSALPLARPLSN